MAGFEEIINKRFPEKIKIKDISYGYLISFIRTNKITNLRRLKSLLASEMNICEKFIRENKNSQTNNRVMREYSRKLAHFKKIKDLIDAYL